MNAMEKQALMDAILTRCPSARFVVTCGPLNSHTEAKAFSSELSHMLNTRPQYKAGDCLEWYSVDNDEMAVGVFFNRAADEPYMIEDVVMTIEESSDLQP